MPGNNAPLVIVDADAIIALSSVGDTNHTRAKHILEYLTTTKAYALFPTTAICEAVTVLRGRLNKPDEATSIVKQFQSGAFPVQAVDFPILVDAAILFDPQASKKNTLFDAVVATIAKRLNAEAIFSFDVWYRKIGLRLTDDLMEDLKRAA